MAHRYMRMCRRGRELPGIGPFALTAAFGSFSPSCLSPVSEQTLLTAHSSQLTVIFYVHIYPISSPRGGLADHMAAL